MRTTSPIPDQRIHGTARLSFPNGAADAQLNSGHHYADF